MVESSLETFARQAYAVNWVAGACMTTLLYSHLLTFSQEVRSFPYMTLVLTHMFIQVARIWPSRLSLAKILFLTNRYLVKPSSCPSFLLISSPH
ncbi:hypothetical protein FA13DRAFT_1802227 [Coprinellus micaceus]|uniref:DUF6533 domain-containing protein n=1 Tax=Coprinellus micaceus TaxID=71717 RepID=A0A4Y7SCN2_COPMI|nr:hypothetical protein FA13DRAFT_1802227 [Coprinellus micaceus]